MENLVENGGKGRLRKLIKTPAPESSTPSLFVQVTDSKRLIRKYGFVEPRALEKRPLETICTEMWHFSM